MSGSQDRGMAMDVTRRWSVLGRHGLQLYGGAPGLVGWASEHAFAILTGEPNLDLNICGLFGDPNVAELGALLAVVDRVAAPTVIATSVSADPTARKRLPAAGFDSLGPEAVMWRAPMPVEAIPGPFDVRRATDERDIAAAGRMIAAARGTAPDLVDRVFNLDAWRAGTIGCWIAFDGMEAASAAWLTTGEGFLGVWEMVTSPLHRRRGAARAALTAAMAEMQEQGPEGTVLWASPLGQPLYEALGFVTFDHVVPWVRGGTDEELALIGASRIVTAG